MKVFRFMSKEEFEKYMNDETLENTTKHKEKNKTNSVGFCFFNIEDFKPEEAMHFLSGIVSLDICAVFEVDESLLTKTHGRYASPIKETGDNFTDLLNLLYNMENTFEATEYCITKYNKESFKLIKHTDNCIDSWTPNGKEDFEWKQNSIV